MKTEKHSNVPTILIMVPCREDMRQRLAQRFAGRCELIYAEGEAAQEKICCADAVIGEPPLEWIARAERLQWIQITWAGADRYTRSGDFPNHVRLTNASGAFGVIISEYVIAGILALYRKLPQYIRNQSEALWRDMGSLQSLYGKRALILGTGDIGTHTAVRLHAFGVTTAGIRRRAECPAPHFDEIYGIDALDALLPHADLVVACLPGTSRTDGLMNEQRLRHMKNDSIFVNVGRGNLTDVAALANVLSERSRMGAVLDVTNPEPLPRDCPLWHMENVILTPHIAGPSFGHHRETEERIWAICTENLDRYLNGMELLHTMDMSE